MSSRLFINTQGSLVMPKQKKSPIFFAKQDPYSNYLWKSMKRGGPVRQIKLLDNFKTRFTRN